MMAATRQFPESPVSQGNAIQIEGLSVRFDGKAVLDGFDLSVAPGEKVALTGRSGSGKTTVLRALLGFVRPDAGVIRIEGEELTGHTVWRLRTKLAYVAQEPDLGMGNVRELLERPFAFRANAHLRENLSKLNDLFAQFLLPRALLEKAITELSGGEKQRVAVISAALLERHIVLLDEASSALDAQARDAVAAFFRTHDDLTVLSVSHDSEGFNVASRAVALPGGFDGERP
jgi:ABC-type multidrug transport system ATPase subunit